MGVGKAHSLAGELVHMGSTNLNVRRVAGDVSNAEIIR